MQPNNSQPQNQPESSTQPVVFEPVIISPTTQATQMPIVVSDSSATTPGRPNYQPATPTPIGFSQTDVLELERKHRRKKRLIMVSILLSVVAVTPFVVYGLFSTSLKLKTVTYDNGEGSQFKLKFYSLRSTANVYSSVSQEKQAAGVNPNLKALYSRVELYGKAPIEFFIVSSDKTESKLAAYANNKGCGKLPIAFTVHNDYVNESLNVCVLRQDNYDLLYIMSFKDQSKYFVATVTQNINHQDAVTSKDKAQAALDRTGLQPYQSDISQILSSISVSN